MISVCMATYNGARYIKEQIDSILTQLGADDELVISDDGSTDDTIEIILGYKDSRIQLYRGSFHSPIYNFENAIKMSKGDYIFMADQDDVWLPNKVSDTVKLLDTYLLVHSNAMVVDADLNVMKDRLFDKIPKSFIACVLKNPYMGCTMAFRKEVKDIILPFPKGMAMHDSWIGLSVQLFQHPFFLNESLIQYRRHGANASACAEKSNFSYAYRITYRIHLLYHLLKRYISIKRARR